MRLGGQDTITSSSFSMALGMDPIRFSKTMTGLHLTSVVIQLCRGFAPASHTEYCPASSGPRAKRIV